MRRISLSLLALLLLAGAAGAADSATLRAAVSVPAGPVCLADLAQLSGAQATRLGQLKITSLPPGRSSLNLSRERVLTVIRRNYKGQIEVLGAPVVRISPQLTSIGRAELVKLYVGQVMQASPWRDLGRIEISEVKVPETLAVLPADLKRMAAEFAPREDFVGPVSLELGFGTSQKVRLSGKVKVYADVPVSRGLKARQPITLSDVELKELELSAYGAVVAGLEQCRGLRTRTAIRPGQPLLRNQVEPLPIVCRGEAVQIEAVGASLVITDSGVALRDGFAGEKIMVKNAGSGRTIIGTVIAPSRVRVVF